MVNRIAVISICSVLLVGVVVAVAVGTNWKSDSNSSGEVKSSMKVIKEICQPTDYAESCEKSLATANSTDPKELVRAGFQAAITELEKVINDSSTLNKMVKDEPMASQALDNCKEHIGSAIDDLKNSINQLMGDLEVSKIDEYIENFKIWLAGAMTYQHTCLDGFNNTESEGGKKMKELLKISHELTSNSLAMVYEVDLARKTNHSQIMFAFGSHRLLLSDNNNHVGLFPSWVGSSQRKLLVEDNKTQSEVEPNVVVAKDNSGQYRTINDALKEVPKNGSDPFVIYIKAGVYEEQVIINKQMKNVVFTGDGPTKTVISGSKNYADGITTFKTATVGVIGEKFMAKNIGIENTAGAKKQKAVALRDESDESIFYNCQIDGYEGTLYAHSHRQFYRDCTISGTIDFIFGDAAAVFQNCEIIIRKPMDNQKCVITSQGRTERREVTGFIIQNCTISGAQGYKDKAYLGRPRDEFSKTIIMQSQIDDIIAPEGWLSRTENFALETLVYAEFNNRGPGADQTSRVTWKGVKKFSEDQAKAYVPVQFFHGDEWIVKSGVPYTPGMITGL